jgi:hypothetical protein
MKKVPKKRRPKGAALFWEIFAWEQSSAVEVIVVEAIVLWWKQLPRRA